MLSIKPLKFFIGRKRQHLMRPDDVLETFSQLAKQKSDLCLSPQPALKHVYFRRFSLMFLYQTLLP